MNGGTVYRGQLTIALVDKARKIALAPRVLQAREQRWETQRRSIRRRWGVLLATCVCAGAGLLLSAWFDARPLLVSATALAATSGAACAAWRFERAQRFATTCEEAHAERLLSMPEERRRVLVRAAGLAERLEAYAAKLPKETEVMPRNLAAVHRQLKITRRTFVTVAERLLFASCSELERKLGIVEAQLAVIGQHPVLQCTSQENAS